MFSEGDDGSAIVSGMPISPFLPVQHNRVDVTTINQLAQFCLHCARENGWCQGKSPILFTSTQEGGSPIKDGSTQCYAPEEGYTPIGAGITVFYAAVEVEMSEKEPSLRPPTTMSTQLLYAQMWVAHVGTSSYSLAGKLWTYEKGHLSEKTELGTMNVTAVQISTELRKPVPIHPPYRRSLEAVVARREADVVLPRITRLDVAASLGVIGGMPHDMQAALAGEPKTDPASDLHFSVRRSFDLRETDMDFNLHLNQGAMMRLVINAFRGALRDKASVFHIFLDTRRYPLCGDLLIRKLRIDYIREVPMDFGCATVALFFDNDAARHAALHLQQGTTESFPVSLDLCFVVIGQKQRDVPQGHLAACGHLSVVIQKGALPSLEKK